MQSSSLIVFTFVLPCLHPTLLPLKANHLHGGNNNGKRRSSAAIRYLIRRVIQLTLSAELRVESHSNCSCVSPMNQDLITRIIDSHILESPISMRIKLIINKNIFVAMRLFAPILSYSKEPLKIVEI